MEWLINDCDLLTIKDQYQLGESLKEFVDNVIYKHPNWNTLLPELSNIYVLVAIKDAEQCLREGEKSWEDIMGEKYEFLEKNGKYIIGWIYINSKEEENIHYIDFIDSTIKGHNIAKIMIDKYEKEGVQLFPEEIISSSAKYWSKMIIRNVDGLIYTNDIDTFIEENSINKNRIKWESLYEICEEGIRSEEESD